MGVGNRASAEREFLKVLGLDPSHLPARLHLNMLRRKASTKMIDSL
jgi:hypothetical protein